MTPNGEWLAVMRTGNANDLNCQDNPIMWSVSRDEGRTWSKPARTGVQGAFPGLAVLPDGIAASDDPILSARSAAYLQSFTRREGEPKTPSAVSAAETGN